MGWETRRPGRARAEASLGMSSGAAGCELLPLRRRRRRRQQRRRRGPHGPAAGLAPRPPLLRTPAGWRPGPGGATLAEACCRAVEASPPNPPLPPSSTPAPHPFPTPPPSRSPTLLRTTMTMRSAAFKAAAPCRRQP